MKNYEILEHTADIRIRIFGKSPDNLFVNSAYAMFDILAEKITCVEPQIKAIIIQEAEDIEELFINWLNELLSLSAAKEIIFSEFKVNKFQTPALKSNALVCQPSAYKINTEIKAATYHGL